MAAPGVIYSHGEGRRSSWWLIQPELAPKPFSPPPAPHLPLPSASEADMTCPSFDLLWPLAFRLVETLLFCLPALSPVPWAHSGPAGLIHHGLFCMWLVLWLACANTQLTVTSRFFAVACCGRYWWSVSEWVLGIFTGRCASWKGGVWTLWGRSPWLLFLLCLPPIPHTNALPQLLLIKSKETSQNFPTPSVNCVLEKALSRRLLCVSHKDTGYSRSAWPLR